MSAIATLDLQRKEMNVAIKELLKTGELKIEDEDIEKADYLLHKHPTMDSIIKDYEKSKLEWEGNMSQYELMNTEGNQISATGHRVYLRNVTEDSVVLKHKSEAVYSLYKTISNIIRNVIDNLKDPHERAIFNMLFVEGKRLEQTRKYFERGYRSDLCPIATTTFWEKRKRAVKKVAASLKLAGVLEVVQEDTRQSRIENKVKYRMVFSEWD